MEKNANYTVAGALCLLLLLGLAVFAVWLAKFQFDRAYETYDLSFDGPVRGLSQGGEVHFNGIKVGDITKLMLDTANPGKVIAEARMQSGVPIKRDSYGTLEPQGITGVNYVQITAGSAGSPLLISGTPNGVTPTIATRRSLLDGLFQDGGTVMSHAVLALDRVNRVLSDENIAAFSGALGDLQVVGDELRTHKAMIADTQKTVRDGDAAAVELIALEKSGHGLLDGDAKHTVRSIGEAAEATRIAAQALQLVVVHLDGAAGNFAANGLPQVTAAAVDLQKMSESLDRLLVDVQSDPRGALTKPSPHEVDVKR